MQLGFVIDHSRCIGCHACTVACKSENEVPVGSFRTWVKYTEKGSFPQVRRSFAVLRCNQCSAAPCVTICPVNALVKRADGIVDVDGTACIGCKSCMQACPYDALYINEDSGTAQKCHFCAHRVEVGLAPACAVVCPTEAIIPGDFHDPNSRVSKLRASGDLVVRKPEAGTGPNVFYREVDPAGIDPSRTGVSGGYIWSNVQPSPQIDTQLWESVQQRAEARTTYDVPRRPLWGWKVSAYLFTKSLASGVFLASAILFRSWDTVGGLTPMAAAWAAGVALLFLFATMVLLVADLKRPERFLLMLTRPNWDSWLVKGGVILTAYGGLLLAWLVMCAYDWLPGSGLRSLLAVLTGLGAALAAMYTAWLFRQARGRPLWMWELLPGHLFAQAIVAGTAAMLIMAPWLDLGAAAQATLGTWLLAFLATHLLFTWLKERAYWPKGRETEFARALAVLSKGPYARRHLLVGLLGGVLVPAILLVAGGPGPLWTIAAVLALVGLCSEEDLFVRAGQAVPIS
ncbi:MAG: polysulfide reductase NrfD [Planctomycetota bacterium]|nr:polysulfide reductase NrfD [Planctomycetota bacterium]